MKKDKEKKRKKKKNKKKKEKKIIKRRTTKWYTLGVDIDDLHASLLSVG